MTRTRDGSTPEPRPTWRYLIAAAQTWADRTARLRVPTAHVDGLAWNQLPPPRRWHHCWPQSWGSCGPFQLIEVCPCGGTRIDQTGPWLDRNWRRRYAARRHQFWGGGPGSGGENVGDTGPQLLVELRTTLQAASPDEGARRA